MNVVLVPKLYLGSDKFSTLTQTKYLKSYQLMLIPQCYNLKLILPQNCQAPAN